MLTSTRTKADWLASPSYDLVWVFGGAALSLVACTLVLGFGASIVPIWWCWLLAFDGPHMAATYARTYLDPACWQKRRPLLLGSLVCLAAGPLWLFLSRRLGSELPFLGFLAGATLWAYYHVVRQHYGFVALYAASEQNAAPKATTRAALRARARWLYLGCAVPYAYFLSSHTRAAAAVGFDPDLAASNALGWLAGATWLVCLFALAAPLRRRPNQLAPSYAAVVVALMGLAFFVVAQQEPVYPASRGPDQDFLLVGVMISVFHNVQYVALVWRYQRGSERNPARVRKLWLFYVGFCALFVVFYYWLAAATGVFPGREAGPVELWGGVSSTDLALSLWWSVAIHHYYLDQRIWRLREEPELLTRMALGPASPLRASTTER